MTYNRADCNGRANKYALMIEMANIGSHNFTLTVLDAAIDQNELWDKEIDWIYRLDSVNPLIGYNKKTGGKGGKLNEESKKRMSIGSMGFRHTEEEKLKRSKKIFAYHEGYIKSYSSAKVLGDILGSDRSVITFCIRHAQIIKGVYPFYADPDARKEVISRIKNPQRKKLYLLIAKAIDRNVEAIEGYTLLYN
jgi:hypothetical protein